MTYEVYGPPSQIVNSDSSTLFSGFEIYNELINALYLNYPLNTSQTCYYDPENVDHFELSLTNPIGLLIAGVILLAIGVIAFIPLFLCGDKAASV